MTEAMYKDSFNKSFTDEMPFLQFLRERESNASWETNETKNIWFHGIENDSSIASMLQKEFDVSGKHDIMADTFANTSLVAEIEGTYKAKRLYYSALAKMRKKLLVADDND